MVWKKIPIHYRYILLLLLVFFIAEVFVNPLRNFPLNDDWSYSKSVKILLEKNKFDIGAWGAMTLATQIYWGFLWTKVFGFSFTVLRISTLLSSCVAVLTMFNISLRITKDFRIAFWTALVLLFIPLYFNLSNTFMTDVNFLTLLLLFVYLAQTYFLNPTRWLFIPLTVLALLLTFLRQFGIIAPLALLGAIVMSRRKDWKGIGFTLFMFLLVIVSLKMYEEHLKSYLPADAPYKFSTGFNLLDPHFFRSFLERFTGRVGTIFLQVLFYTAPFCIVFLPNALQRASGKRIVITFILTVAPLYYFLSNYSFFCGNIISNMAIGPETFYESLQHHASRNYSAGFENMMPLLIFLFCGITLFTLMLGGYGVFQKHPKSPFAVFCLFLALAYIGLLLMAESYFDRYHLPLIALVLIAASSMLKDLSVRMVPGVILLAVFFYSSVAGTKDYLEWNDQRWQAYRDLRSSEVPAHEINGGFEVNCWADGEEKWWSNILTLEGYRYLIQFRPEPGFKVVRYYPFRRYYPVGKDTLTIYKRSLEEDSIPLAP